MKKELEKQIEKEAKQAIKQLRQAILAIKLDDRIAKKALRGFLSYYLNNGVEKFKDIYLTLKKDEIENKCKHERKEKYSKVYGGVECSSCGKLLEDPNYPKIDFGKVIADITIKNREKIIDIVERGPTLFHGIKSKK